MNLRKMENIEISRFTARIGDFILGFYLLCALFARRLATGWAGTSAHHIKVTGFEPMALCTQNRCADQTALHLVSPSEAYRSTIVQERSHFLASSFT